MHSGPFFTLIILSIISGCGKESNKTSSVDGPEEVVESTEDLDGDGVTVGDGDCDDQDDRIHPGRLDSCNGLDDNCNGVIDEGHPDTDDDNIADCVDTEDCDGVDNNGDGIIDEGFDLDGDGEADCPSAEVCDGEDNDQDGLVDEDFDVDGDGFTECGNEDLPPDCDDNDSAVHPGAPEVDADLIDND
ncbi:MAG: MopE-related protein, partial [Myxococcota bacterium]